MPAGSRCGHSSAAIIATPGLLGVVIPAAADLLPVAADGWFNVVAGRCLYGATVDGMGGDGDDPVSAEALPFQCLLLAISGCDSAESYMRLSDDLVGRGMPSWIRTSSQWLVLLANCSSTTQAWLAAHLTLAVALRMMRQELPGVGNTRAAAALLQQILHQAHSEIMQVGRLA